MTPFGEFLQLPVGHYDIGPKQSILSLTKPHETNWYEMIRDIFSAL